MLGLDPTIMEHHIDTWPDGPPIWQKQHLMHPAKAMAIKSEINKLQQAKFIFLIEYTSWVSNLIPVTKK